MGRRSAPWRRTRTAVTRLEAAALLLCELDGLAADVAADVARVQGILEQAAATEIRRARDEAERAQFWSGRKAAFPAVGRLAPDYYCMDGTIPRRHLRDRARRESAALSAAHGLPVANVFHAGDGNLHPLIMFDAGRPGDIERAERFGAEILELCIAVGGTVTGEHGVGVEKLGPMCSQFGGDGAGDVSCGEARLRPARPAEPRQGRADARALRGLRCAARARRPAALPRPAALLIAYDATVISHAATRRRDCATRPRGAHRCALRAVTRSASTAERSRGRRSICVITRES